MRYCCMFEIMTIHMHKLVKIFGIVKSPKQLCSAQYVLSSAETRWRSNHELTLLCKYTGTLVFTIAGGRCARILYAVTWPIPRYNITHSTL